MPQAQIDKGWADLKKAHNEKSVTKARELAFMIEQGNDIEIVGSFIRLIDEYSDKWVTEATQMTARMRADNPSRNFGYIVGILKKWEK